MTTIKTTRSQGRFRLPDPPEREPDKMTSFTHIARTGAAYLLAEHLGNPDATLVAGEHYITPVPTQDGALTIRHSGIRLDTLAAVVSCQRALTTLHRA